jgi:hypothetical protein
VRSQDHFGRLTREIEGLKERKLIDIEAKALMHDVFAQGLMPVRFLPEVSHSYFEPDFEPRNAWSLHNAFTTSAKRCPCPRPFRQSRRSGSSLACRAKRGREYLPAGCFHRGTIMGKGRK